MSETLKSLPREQILAENRDARESIERRLRRWKSSPQMAELMDLELEQPTQAEMRR